MIKTKVIENFPEYAVNYAYYGENNGLMDNDIKAINEFMKNYVFFGIVENSENGFCKYPVFGLSCRTVDILVGVKN